MNITKLLRSFTVLCLLAIVLGSPLPVSAEETTGAISGYVRNEQGQLLAHIPIVISSDSGDFMESNCTGEDGYYQITGIPFDTEDPYTVEAAGNGVSCGWEYPYARTYWPNAPFADTAETFLIDSIQPEKFNVDFWLPLGGTISGVVVDINGTQLPSGRVSIALNLEDYSFPTELYTCSDYDGNYAIKHIPLNVNYKVAAGVFPCPDNLEGYGSINAWPDSLVNSGGQTRTPTTSNPDIYNVDFYLRPLGATPTGDEVLTVISTGFITFENVDSAGATTVEPIEFDPPSAPPNFRTLEDRYYELSTTASFSSAQVCFRYDDSTLSAVRESQVRLLHKENFTWVDVTDAGYPDTANNVVCGTVSSFSPFAVAEALHDFSGFFQPVDNLPTLNVIKAGSAIPVKFSLGGDQGLNIFEAGYPRSQVIACDSVAPVDGIEETVSANSSGLSYDAGTGQYTYAWKTDRSWANTCRQLVIKLDDGTVQRANFKFR